MEHSRNVTRPMLTIAGTAGYAVAALPMAAPLVLETPAIFGAGGDLALQGYVTLQNSSLAQGALALLAGLHIYNLATDEEYRGQTLSFDSGTGISSIGMAAEDIFSLGRSIVSHPYLSPSNYDWSPLFGWDAIREGRLGSGWFPGLPRINIGEAGHHVPAVRKTLGRPFEIGREDKTRPTIFFRDIDPGQGHWLLHNAERPFVGPRQGPFIGSDSELFDAYRKAYTGLDDIRVDVRSPDSSQVLGLDVSPLQAVDLIEAWLRDKGLR